MDRPNGHALLAASVVSGFCASLQVKAAMDLSFAEASVTAAETTIFGCSSITAADTTVLYGCSSVPTAETAVFLQELVRYCGKNHSVYRRSSVTAAENIVFYDRSSVVAKETTVICERSQQKPQCFHPLAQKEPAVFYGGVHPLLRQK